MTGYRVRVVDAAGLEDWRRLAAAVPGRGFHDAVAAHIAATGETVLCWTGHGPSGFTWACPGCGGTVIGTMAGGGGPVAGWDAPRWVNTGTLERPTLHPSLGCPLWRQGRCPGHWQLRDGQLTPA